MAGRWALASVIRSSCRETPICKKACRRRPRRCWQSEEASVRTGHRPLLNLETMRELALFHQSAHTLCADPHLDTLPVGRGQRRLLKVGAPHAVGAALGKAHVVAKRRPFAAHFTLS